MKSNLLACSSCASQPADAWHWRHMQFITVDYAHELGVQLVMRAGLRAPCCRRGCCCATSCLCLVRCAGGHCRVSFADTVKAENFRGSMNLRAGRLILCCSSKRMTPMPRADGNPSVHVPRMEKRVYRRCKLQRTKQSLPARPSRLCWTHPVLALAVGYARLSVFTLLRAALLLQA